MKTRAMGWVVGAVLVAATASAQEASEDAEPRREPTRRIKVLHNPYDLASFYRSSSPSAPVYFGGPIDEPRESRYPIASFYRQGGGQGRYSQFWTSSPSGSRRGAAPRRFRRVGPAELCMLAPTFLAPAAPLTEIER
jgi:hypothetical protein